MIVQLFAVAYATNEKMELLSRNAGRQKSPGLYAAPLPFPNHPTPPLPSREAEWLALLARAPARSSKKFLGTPNICNWMQRCCAVSSRCKCCVVSSCHNNGR